MKEEKIVKNDIIVREYSLLVKSRRNTQKQQDEIITHVKPGKKIFIIEYRFFLWL